MHGAASANAIMLFLCVCARGMRLRWTIISSVLIQRESYCEAISEQKKKGARCV